MAKRDPIRSAKIREYAAAAGVDLRTAQRHANQELHRNHCDWVKFSGEKKFEISKSSEATSGEVALPPLVAPVVDGSEEGQMVNEIWNLWTTTKSDRDSAEDPGVRVVLAKALIEIRRDYQKAKVAYETARRDREQVLDYSDFEVIHNQFAVPVAQLFREMPRQVARNDEELSRFTDWVKDTAQPALLSFIQALAGKVPTLAA